MTDITAVRTALATRISTGMAGTALAGRSFAYAPDSPNPPCAIVMPSDGEFVNYDVSYDGQDDFELVVKLLAGTEINRTAEAQLLGWLAKTGSTSVRAAIYGDRTLGGVVSDVRVEGARGYGDVDYAGVVFFGAELVVTVYA
jgi:hypothetical protein